MAFTFAVIREFRASQWIKNLAVFGAITFSGQLFNPQLFKISFFAFLAFCFLSSACYILNDFFDLEHDKKHPLKKYRPLARGTISPTLAGFLAVVLILISFYIALSVTFAFFLALVFYLFLALSYSLVLKNIAVVDILAIAIGYFLRVIAGEFATGFHISAWLVLTAISLSLFLAIGKRRIELGLLSAAGAEFAKVRKSLTHYSERLLDQYLSIFATATFISYSLFTFLDKPMIQRFSLDVFSENFLSGFERKWLMLTIPLVVFGLMRYLQDIYEKKLGERPEKVLLADKFLLLDIFIWGVSVVFILYFLGTV